MTEIDREIKEWEGGFGIKLLRKIGIRPAQNILDFGCNKGNYSIPAAKIVGKTGRVFALDIDSKALDELMKTAKSEGLTNIEKVNTSGELNIPIENELIDAVLIFDVIHLMGWEENKKRSLRKDRKKLYKEIWRIAKPNAIILVYPNHLKTHTDISSIEDVRKEIEDSGFVFENDLHEILIHDNELMKGHILNFKKQ